MLRLIHELAEGQIERRIPAHVLRSREGISMTTLEQVLSYLRDEKLIDAPRHDFHSVSLRHKGLVEVERAILNPSAGTEHFDPKVTAAYRRDPTGRTRTMRIVGPDVG
jgi:hypothetical protein